MIADSANKTFDFVLVYSLDRFSRSKIDSVKYKAILIKNGVRVISAKENITDDPAGALIESVFEGIGEYYSKELSVKISRNGRLNAERGQFNRITQNEEELKEIQNQYLVEWLKSSDFLKKKSNFS